MAPIARNLTSVFVGQRRSRCSKGRSLGRQIPTSSEGHRLLQCDQAAGDLEACLRPAPSLPPLWVDNAAEIKSDLSSIRKLLGDLARAQQRRKINVMDNGSQLDQRVQQFTSEINALIRSCEQKLFRMKPHVAVCNLGQNAHKHLAMQLQQVTLQFREAQQKYVDELKKRHRVTPVEDTCTMPSWSTPGNSMGLDALQLEEEATTASEFAMERNAEIEHICKSVSDLHQIFKEMAVLVIDQGTILDRIDYNIEHASIRAKDAKDEIILAEKAQKNNRSTKCILILAVINVILVLVLVVKTRAS